jgi:broad specificity phosphatase PhoE
MSKKIFCIRHGEALHNVLFWKMGEKTYLLYRDTPLTLTGVKQAQQLGDSYFTLGSNKIDLIIVSPLLRTLQTATNIFCKNPEDVPPCPIIALDCVMEYPQGLDQCNHRKSIREYEYCFPHVDFSNIQYDQDPFWKKYEMETIENLDMRFKKMKEFIKSRPEKNIVLVSHSSYLGWFLNNDIGDEQNELAHCKVYETNI